MADGRVIRYSPSDRPTCGGWACTIAEKLRKFSLPITILAGKRVVSQWDYQPTGDKAFDLRASAFRKLLLAGTEEAYEESPNAFLMTGL
jgi:hypothetical protein